MRMYTYEELSNWTGLSYWAVSRLMTHHEIPRTKSTPVKVSAQDLLIGIPSLWKSIALIKEFDENRRFLRTHYTIADLQRAMGGVNHKVIIRLLDEANIEMQPMRNAKVVYLWDLVMAAPNVFDMLLSEGLQIPPVSPF